MRRGPSRGNRHPESTGPKIRAFVAIPIDAGLREGLVRLIGRMSSEGSRIRWVSPETIHLTLHFLGDVDPRRVPDLLEAVAASSEGIPPFDVEVAGVGAFPHAAGPRVVWTGVRDESGALVRLHAEMGRHLASMGHREENRAFRAHLTLGRLRGRDPATDWPAILAREAATRIGTVEVDEVVLFMSELTREGPIHTPLGRVPLEG